MGLMDSFRQEFGELVVHTPHGTSRYDLPWTFSTFDYRELCRILFEGCDAEFETAKIEGRAPGTAAAERRPEGQEFSCPSGYDQVQWQPIAARFRRRSW